MRHVPAIVALSFVVLAAAACGGNGDGETQLYGTVSRATKTHACSSLDDADVVRVSGFTDPRRFDFSFPDGQQIECSTGWSAGVVSAIVTITERAGGAATLRRLRRLQLSDLGASEVKPFPTLGEGAFFAGKRYLAFLRDDHAVTLETGLGDSGLPVLKRSQLVELARLAQG